MPSAARLATAVSLGQNRRSQITSATTRLTSSGIARSNERRPDSTCPDAKPDLAATRAPASVEFVSPYVSTRSGASAASTGSRPAIIRAVCTAWGPQAPSIRWSGGAQLELGEEHVGELGVVVLPGVDEHVLADRVERADERRGLDELWPVADHGDDLHASSLTAEPGADLGELAGREQDADEHQHQPGRARHGFPVRAQRPRRGQRGRQPDARRPGTGWRGPSE